MPQYLAGAPLLEVFPLVPSMGNMTLGVGALCYAGQFNITAVADGRPALLEAPIRPAPNAHLPKVLDDRARWSRLVVRVGLTLAWTPGRSS